MTTFPVKGLTILFLILLFGGYKVTHAASIDFMGKLGFIETDLGGAVYSGVPLDTEFTGSIDDATFTGFITDRVTRTDFDCCIAAGGLEITNDMSLTSDQATFLNTLIGFPRYSENDVVDGVDIEGDASTSGDGRIEVGLSYVLDGDSFTSTDPGNYPFDMSKVQVALFFILEEDSTGDDIYSAAGLISAVPVPAAMWLFGAGILGLFGMLRRNVR